jgi:3-oxoacyl-[acyl-carrier protein] reductase
MTLQNKNVAITGAYGGLGKSLALAYFNKGCNLFLMGRNVEKLIKLKDELEVKKSFGPTIQIQPCDLGNNQSINKAIENGIALFGHIDILVNCAGIFPIKSMDDMTLYEFDECIQINLTAPFVLTKAFTKKMKEKKWGRIVNIASSSAYGGGPNTSAYCASKHALLGLSRSLYKELKQDGVRVFCVSPGSIQTEMGREVEKLGQTYDTFMTPDEVAEYVVYSTSLDGNMISEEIRLNRVFIQ